MNDLVYQLLFYLFICLGMLTLFVFYSLTDAWLKEQEQKYELRRRERPQQQPPLTITTTTNKGGHNLRFAPRRTRRYSE
jgi:hypothetical protein